MNRNEWNKGGREGVDEAKGLREFKYDMPISDTGDSEHKGGLDRHADAFGDNPKPKSYDKHGEDYSQKQGMTGL